MDTLGFGNSAGSADQGTICIRGVATSEALGLSSVSIVGHHTGGVVAMEVAAETGPRQWTGALESTVCR
jgi:hypothetical protein